MKHNNLKLIIAIALILILPLSLLLTAVSLPSYYGESYYAELAEMYHRLYNTEGKKLVVIGGSNVAFGLDTALLEDTLREYGYDYTVCPFGLYAAVGTSAMLELARDALSEGDIVVLAIEPTSETMFTYFGATAFWKCCEDSPEMLLKLSKSQQSAMVGSYVPYLQERYGIFTEGNAPKAEGIYAKSSFDESCNMIYDRAGNTMALGYDTASPVALGDVVIEADFAEQVNDFCAHAQSKGAAVYFSFSPVNRSALADEENVQSYFDLCNRTFLCPVISDPSDYILDSGWFYDSNFHLNSAGAELRTIQLAKDLLAQLGCYEKVEYDLPEMPASIAQIETNTADERYFRFEALGEGWLVSGLTEEGLAQTSLTVPVSVDGKPVVGFTEDALTGAELLEELTLPASIESLPDRIFAGCSSLERLVLEHTQKLCSISDETFTGADKVRIFVPTEAYPLYREGDGCEANPWSEYLDRIFSFG